MEYTELTIEQRKAIVDGRIASYEADYFGHTLNLAAFDSLPDSDPGKAEAISTTQAALATLASSIDAMRAVLATLTG